MHKRQKNKLFVFATILIVIGAIVAYPKIEIREEIRYEDILCKHIEQEDEDLVLGVTKIVQECKNGKRKIVENVTYKNSKAEKHEQISNVIEQEAIDEIKLVGTKQVAVDSAPTQNINADSETAPTKNIEYSDERQYGTCKDGTATYGNPHAKGRANSCYGHGGWIGN